MSKRKILLMVVLVLFTFLGKAQTTSTKVDFQPGYRWISSGNYVQDKNFYLLTLMEKLPAVQQQLAADPVLKSLLAERVKNIREATGYDLPKPSMESLRAETSRWADLFLLSSDDIEKVGNELAKMWKSDKVLQSLVTEQIRPSGAYEHFAGLDDAALLAQAWKSAAEGINGIIRTYALGEKPLYPKIDSVSYDVKSQYYRMLINMLASNVGDDTPKMKLFFQPSLSFSLWLLKMNHRDEAARFEPMITGENAKAWEQIKQTNFDDYPYSVIMLPGYGPEKKGVDLSPAGMLRCKLAAERYFEKKAPFIIASGGYVHPDQTPFCEAVEMKKELMQQYGVPESAIIIEPHARHTTTNYRNAVRLMVHYGIPINKKALCTTTKGQSYYITDMDFDKRCVEAFGYMPYVPGKRLSRNDTEFTPRIESLTIDPKDPLDP